MVLVVSLMKVALFANSDNQWLFFPQLVASDLLVNHQ
jgi:hypothetical protein